MAGPLSTTGKVCVCVGYSRGIFNGAQYYSRNGIGQQQFRNDVSGALRGSGASAAAAAGGDHVLAVAVETVHVRPPPMMMAVIAL